MMLTLEEFPASLFEYEKLVESLDRRTRALGVVAQR